MANIGSLVLTLEAQSAAFIRDLDRSTQAVQRSARQMVDQSSTITKGFNTAATAAKNLAAGFGLAFSATALIGAARTTFAWADSLSELSKRVGITVEQLQRLQRAGELTNISAEAITNNLQQFARRLGDASQGSGQFAEVLERNNIALRGQGGELRSVSAVFDDYVDRIINAETEQEALSLAVAGFGRSGSEFVTTLQAMQGGLSDLNVLTEQQIEALARYDDKITEVSQTLEFRFKQALATTVQGLQIQAAAQEQAGDALLGLIDRLLGTDLAQSGQKAATAMADLEAAVAKAGQSAATAGSAGFEPLVIDIHKAVAATEELTAQQRRLQEAGKFLLTTSAQEERFSAAAAAIEQQNAELARQGEQMSRTLESMFEGAAADFPDQDAAASLLEEILK